LLRDRDASYGAEFCNRVEAMGITEVMTAPRSPWQNAYVEPVIGSIRCECLDHIVIFKERYLRRVLSSYVDYYQRTRTHLSLDSGRSFWYKHHSSTCSHAPGFQRNYPVAERLVEWCSCQPRLKIFS
jgi:transposase InsO family protein